MLTDYERNQAIKEGHKNNACAGYFQARTGLPPSKEDARLFDAGFCRGWDASRAPLLEQIAELETEVERFRTDAMNEKLARQELDRLLAQTSGMNELQRMRIAALDAKLAQRVPDGFKWPTMPKSRGQSAVLFDDGYEEGWSRCLEECRQPLSAAPAVPEQQEPLVNERKTFESPEFSLELDAGFAAQEYCRSLWGAARGHSDWRKFHDAFVAGYKVAQQAEQAPNAQQAETKTLESGGIKTAQQAEAQEPVAWANFTAGGGIRIWSIRPDDAAWSGLPLVPLFTRPQPAQLQALSEEEVSDALLSFSDESSPYENSIDGMANCIQLALAAKNGVVLV